MAPGLRNHRTRPRGPPKPPPATKDTALPAVEKKYVSTTALFEAGPRHVQKRHLKEAHVPAPSVPPQKKANPSKKKRSGKNVPTKRKRSPSPSSSPPPFESSRHPLLAELDAALNAYHDTVRTENEGALEPIHEKILARLANGPFPDDPNSLSNRLQQALSLDATLRAPLASHEVKVRFRHSDGSSKTGRIALGVTLARFEKLLIDKQAELQGLWKEWADVRRDIVYLGAEILDEPSFPVQFGLEALSDDADKPKLSVSAFSLARERMDALAKEVDLACEQSCRELRELDLEDAMVKKEKEKQWNAFLKGDV